MAAIESERRKKAALEAIKRAFDAKDEEADVVLFVDHHLAELPASYWQRHLGSDAPRPSTVLGLLQFRSSWGENDIEYFDFTLPEEVTNYVVCAHFNDAGSVDSISMES